MGVSMKKTQKRVSKKSGKHVIKHAKKNMLTHKKGGKLRRSKINRRQKRRTRRHVQRGGWNLGNIISNFPFGQDVTNIARSAGTGMTNIYRGVKGVKKSVGQYPTQNQLSGKLGSNSGGNSAGKPMDMAAIYKKNKQTVKGI